MPFTRAMGLSPLLNVPRHGPQHWALVPSQNSLETKVPTAPPQGPAISVSEGYKAVLAFVMRRSKCQALDSPLFYLEVLCPWDVI